jgi:hypothetical protein
MRKNNRTGALVVPNRPAFGLLNIVTNTILLVIAWAWNVSPDCVTFVLVIKVGRLKHAVFEPNYV